MVAKVFIGAAAAAALLTACVFARPETPACNVRARTDAGWMCGLTRWGEDGAVYASFRGVPYAKQPVGKLRFKELQPAEPWNHLLDATEEGPVCYQTDVIYGRLMHPREMSEACITANVHVPIEALPETSQRNARKQESQYHAGVSSKEREQKGLPILVFIHGGAFLCGSGDSDLHGPEYLVSKNVIVITFNYRLNVFGFLSLNSKEIPGNQGLRDQLTLLRWVQKNARYFGGDPDNVTLMGQSAGATSAHLLTLSSAANGLYKRAYLMSGTAISGFFSPSPLFAQTISKAFLTILGINSTDTEAIHRQLTEVPVEKINDVHKILVDQFGLITFVPTVESEFPGVTRVVDDYPEVLLTNGRGKDVPLIIGFTDSECEVFRPRLEQIDIASRITENYLLTVPAKIIYSTDNATLPNISKKIDQKYYNSTISTQGFINYCTDGLYKYPALKLAENRSKPDAAPVFLYQFAYDSKRSVLREAFDLKYKGAAHIEDLTYVFRTNSMQEVHSSLPLVTNDDYMRDWMTNFLIDFMHCSNPVCQKSSAWPSVTSRRVYFQDIKEPTYSHKELTKELKDILKFFENLK